MTRDDRSNSTSDIQEVPDVSVIQEVPDDSDI